MSRLSRRELIFLGAFVWRYARTYLPHRRHP